MTLSRADLSEEQRGTTVEFAHYQMDDDAFYDFAEATNTLNWNAIQMEQS
jgi:hypothetical protein